MNNKLLDNMRKIVNKHDPIGIYFGKKINFDEYDLEIKDIYELFKKCKNRNEFLVGVHTTFIKWFTAGVAGTKEKYRKLSTDLFGLLHKNALTK